MAKTTLMMSGHGERPEVQFIKELARLKMKRLEDELATPGAPSLGRSRPTLQGAAGGSVGKLLRSLWFDRAGGVRLCGNGRTRADSSPLRCRPPICLLCSQRSPPA